MAKYIDIELLREEINKKIVERGKELKSFSNKDYVCREASNVAWRKRGYLDVIELLDSLQQEKPIQVNTLTWRDINDLERIINNVHYEFRNGIGEKSFGEEVLERFRAERDEQERHIMEEDWVEKRKQECGYRRLLADGSYQCERYEGVFGPCDGRCSWIVDYPKLKKIEKQQEVDLGKS